MRSATVELPYKVCLVHVFSAHVMLQSLWPVLYLERTRNISSHPRLGLYSTRGLLGWHIHKYIHVNFVLYLVEERYCESKVSCLSTTRTQHSDNDSTRWAHVSLCNILEIKWTLCSGSQCCLLNTVILHVSFTSHSKLYLNPLHRHPETAKKRPPFC